MPDDTKIEVHLFRLEDYGGDRVWVTYGPDGKLVAKGHARDDKARVLQITWARLRPVDAGTKTIPELFRVTRYKGIARPSEVACAVVDIIEAHKHRTASALNQTIGRKLATIAMLVLLAIIGACGTSGDDAPDAMSDDAPDADPDQPDAGPSLITCVELGWPCWPGSGNVTCVDEITREECTCAPPGDDPIMCRDQAPSCSSQCQPGTEVRCDPGNPDVYGGQCTCEDPIGTNIRCALDACPDPGDGAPCSGCPGYATCDQTGHCVCTGSTTACVLDVCEAAP